MTLAELIQEAEEQLAYADMIGRFTGARLVAVVKAAAIMRTFIAYDTSDVDPGDTLGWNEMLAAFDLAAGEGGDRG